MILPLFLWEATFGALQGIQAFTRLGFVQVAQSGLRLVLTVILILLGGRAAGALFAQPLSCSAAAVLTLWWLRPYLRGNGAGSADGVNWSFPVSTVLGLAVFGLITNLDALFVKVFYSPEIAGDYGPVVT